MIDLDELMRLREAATPGPWKHRYAWREDVFSGSIKNEDGEDVSTDNHADAAFICAACNAIPELVQRVRELERLCEQQQHRLDLKSTIIAELEKRHD